MKSGYLTLILILSNFVYSYSQNDVAEFLTGLGKEKPDSTKTWNQTFYKNGVKKTETITYYSHYNPYHLKEFIKKDSITVFRRFRKGGAAKELEVLLPSFQGYFLKHFYNHKRRKTRTEFYKVSNKRLYHNFSGKADYSALQKRTVAKYDRKGDEHILWEFRPTQWLVKEDNGFLKITDIVWTKQVDQDIEGYRYATIEKRKTKFLISIFNPKTGSVTAVIPLERSNRLFKGQNESEIAKFFAQNIRILPNHVLVYVKHPYHHFLDYKLNERLVWRYNEYTVMSKPNSDTKLLKVCLKDNWKTKCTLYDFNGKQILSSEYDKIEKVGSYLKAVSGRKEKLFDYDGNEITPSSRTLEVSNKEIQKLNEALNSDNSLLTTIYLNKKKRDTIHVSVVDVNLMPKYSKFTYRGDVGILENGDRWVIIPDVYTSDFSLIEDKYVLYKIPNPQIEQLSPEFKVYYNKLTDLPADAGYYKGEILDRYPDISLNNSKYVLANLENNTRDTVKMPQGFLEDQVYSYLYLDGEEFVNGFIRVYKSGEDYKDPFHTFLSDQGELVKPIEQYNKIHTDFNEYGQAIVSRSVKRRVGSGENFGVIDTKGNEVLPCDFYSIKLHNDGYLLRRVSDGMAGLISFEQRTLMNFEFEDISSVVWGIHNPYIYTEEIEVNLQITY